MTYVLTAVSMFWNFVFAVSFTFLTIFVVLAYTDPTALDSLVHQAHDVIPAFIDRVTHTVKTAI